MSRLTLKELKDKDSWKVIKIDDILVDWTKFTDLADTPSDYDWKSWQIVAVKSSEDWVEFIEQKKWWGWIETIMIAWDQTAWTYY